MQFIIYYKLHASINLFFMDLFIIYGYYFLLI